MIRGQGSPPLPPALLGSLLAHCRDATLPPAGHSDLCWETLTSSVARTIFLGLLEPALGPGSLSLPLWAQAGGPVAAGPHAGDQRRGWERVFTAEASIPVTKRRVFYALEVWSSRAWPLSRLLQALSLLLFPPAGPPSFLLS